MTPEQIARFWAKVDKSGDCWLWTGSTNDRGEGRVRIAGKLRAARTVAYELERGPLPKGWHRWTCAVPACVRPHHLRKGAKLSEQDVRAIRTSDESGRVVAARYGVSRPMIQKIRSHQAWAHVV